MNFQAGKKVVCISDKWEESTTIIIFTFINIFGKPKGPKKDKMYNIGRVGRCADTRVLYLKLKEFPNDWFTAHSFEPVDETYSENILENIVEQIKEEYFTK